MILGCCLLLRNNYVPHGWYFEIYRIMIILIWPIQLHWIAYSMLTWYAISLFETEYYAPSLTFIHISNSSVDLRFRNYSHKSRLSFRHEIYSSYGRDETRLLQNTPGVNCMLNLSEFQHSWTSMRLREF